MIHDNGFFQPPTYFLSYNKENELVNLQLAKQKWITFFVDEEIRKFEHLLKSLGFNCLGEKEIHHDLFISKHDYPKFAKSGKYAFIWIFFGIISILLGKMVSKSDYFLFTNIAEIYDTINGIAKENPAIVFIMGVAVSVFISQFEKIKSNFRNWVNSFKEL